MKMRHKFLKTRRKKILNQFLVCDELWQKFGIEFNYLDVTTQKFAIIFEISKAKIFIKEIKKLELLNTKVMVISKTFIFCF